MRQFLRYGIIGAFNTALTYGLYVLLLPYVDYRVAIIICYAVGIVVSFLLNRAMVFGSSGHFGRFVSLYVVLLGVNIAVTSALVEFAGIHKALAQLPAIGVVFLLGFFANRAYVFRSSSDRRGSLS